MGLLAGGETRKRPPRPDTLGATVVINQLDLDNVGGLVVTDDNHEILGIITEHDIARGLKNHGRNVVDKPLRDLMTKDVISVDINETLTRVLELMDQHRIRQDGVSGTARIED